MYLKSFFKKNNLVLFLALFFFSLFSTNSAEAQVYRDTVTVWKVGMKDGNVIYGRIISKNNKRMFFKTENLGTLMLRRKDIDYREVYVEAVEEDERWGAPPIYSRYILTPTGMVQKKGRGYYENKYVFINHFNVAFSDNFSLGVGMMPLFLFDGAATPFWLTPKIHFPTKNKKLNFSTGVFWGSTLFDEYNDGDIFLGFLAATYGTKNISFSMSVGFGSAYGETMRGPSISYSGSIRVSKRTSLYLENLFIPVDNYNSDNDKLLMFSIGARTNWRKITLDFGLLAMKDDAEIFFYNQNDVGAVPYLGIIVPF